MSTNLGALFIQLFAANALVRVALPDKRSDERYAALTKYDPRLDNPSPELVKSIQWQDLPKQEAVNNIAKILNSPLLESFTRGDFNFLDDIIRNKEIKFQDIAEAHRQFTVKPWAEIIKEQITKIKTALGLSVTGK